MSKKIISLLFVLMSLCLLLISCKKNTEEHNYIETVFPPTCQEMGYTQKLCKDCGDELLYNYMPRATHSGDTWIVAKEPTCQVAGTEERVCKTCNIAFETRIIAKLGHVEGEWVTTKQPTCKATGVEKLFCSTCGIDLETRTLEVTDKHDFNTKVTPPTTASDGYTTYTCTVCNFSKKDDYVSKIEVPTELTPNDVYEKVAPSMVRIESYDKSGKRYALGSGFFISGDGKIATNFHVINSAYSIKAITYAGTSYDVIKVVGYDPDKDVAILKVNAENAPYLTIAKEEARVGDTVYTIGSPKGLDDIFAIGIVSNEDVVISGKDCISFTAPISTGNSGGPLLNKDGEVLGINTMTIADSQNLNFAVKAYQIDVVEKNITPSELYDLTLQSNAYDILYVNIMINANGMIGEQYIVYSSLAETADNVGFEYYIVFDAEAENVTVKINIIKKGKRTHSVELVMTSVAEQYRYAMYDYDLGQYTIESTVNAKMPSISYATDFESLFNINVLRYTDNDETPKENMKQIFFVMYGAVLEHLGSYISKSNTGLSLENFNFNR